MRPREIDQFRKGIGLLLDRRDGQLKSSHRIDDDQAKQHRVHRAYDRQVLGADFVCRHEVVHVERLPDQDQATDGQQSAQQNQERRPSTNRKPS